jgi:hypothetical protein
MPVHHCPLLHPDCHALHDGLDSDDIGFPPIRVCETTPDSPTNRPNSLRQHQSSSKRGASSSSSPRLPSSHPAKKGLRSKNILNTIQITVHQPKVFQILSLAPVTPLNDLQDVPHTPKKRSSEYLDTANHRPSKRQRSIDENSDDMDWLKQEIDDIRERIIEQVNLKLDEILHELRQWSQI